MTAFVVDASVAAAWLFKDEIDPAADRLLEQALDGDAVVPTLWHVEIANAILQAEKRGRIAPHDVARRLELLGALPIETDVTTFQHVANVVLPLARKHGLTTYDAMYLELAARLDVPLATKDSKLIDAAARSGISTLPRE